MPQIAPFRAIRYNPQRFGRNVSPLIAPPYDVLNEQDKAALLKQHDRNIVAVDLPHVPPKSAGPDEVYTRAASVLKQWQAEQTLIREDVPSLYVYHQIYTHVGKEFTRKMFFARMRLEPFGTGQVFPHEQTFGGPKEDRLKLMQATRCQLSAVFGLYSDPTNAVSALLNMSNIEPDVTATMEGVLNRVWTIRDNKTIQSVCTALGDRPVYIADGHHRYGTALTYRDWLTAQQGALPPDHPAQFVLVGFCAMEDPGAVILPTHRVLTGFNNMAALGKGLRLEAANLKNTPSDAEILSLDAPHDVMVYNAESNQLFTGTFTNRAALNTLAPDRSAAWRKLDLAYLHRYLIDELLTRETLGGVAPTIHYIKSANDAMQDARDTKGIALLCKPCTMTELRGVSQAGDLMPQKSTYFYPKLATGLVIHPLD